MGMDGLGNLGFGIAVNGVINDFPYVSFTPLIPATVRISVTGTGAGRRVSGAYNIGAGWVLPAAWQNKDWGAVNPGYIFDGGKAGILGYNNTHVVKIDSMTIRNLP